MREFLVTDTFKVKQLPNGEIAFCRNIEAPPHPSGKPSGEIIFMIKDKPQSFYRAEQFTIFVNQICRAACPANTSAVDPTVTDDTPQG